MVICLDVVNLILIMKNSLLCVLVVLLTASTVFFATKSYYQGSELVDVSQVSSVTDLKDDRDDEVIKCDKKLFSDNNVNFEVCSDKNYSLEEVVFGDPTYGEGVSYSLEIDGKESGINVYSKDYVLGLYAGTPSFVVNIDQMYEAVKSANVDNVNEIVTIGGGDSVKLDYVESLKAVKFTFVDNTLEVGKVITLYYAVAGDYLIELSEESLGIVDEIL